MFRPLLPFGVIMQRSPFFFPSGSLKKLVDEHQLVVFRDQGDMSPSQKLKLAQHVGDVIRSPVHSSRTLSWHSDGCFLPHAATMTLLHVHPEIDVKDNAELRFSCMYRAYQNLDVYVKKKLGDMQAVFDERTRYVGNENHFPVPLCHKAIHSLVRLHPDTQKPHLFVNDAYAIYVLGMRRDHSARFLHKLCHYSTRGDFQLIHRYQPGDLLLWDNQSLVHKECGVSVEKTEHLIVRRDP